MIYHSTTNDDMLTNSEFKVYMLVVERAMSHKQIAAELDTCINTVSVHLRNIFDKTGMSSKLELLVQYHQREQMK